MITQTTWPSVRTFGTTGLYQPSRTPFWLRLTGNIHASGRGWAVLATDGALLVTAGLVAGLTAGFALLLTAAVLLAFNFARVYVVRSPLETQGVLWYPTLVAVPLAVVALVFIAAAGRVGVADPNAVKFIVLAMASLVGLRLLTWWILFLARRAGLGLRHALIVGHGATPRLLLGRLAGNPEAGLRPVGILSPNGEHDRGAGVGVGALPADLPAIIRYARVNEVVLVPDGHGDVGISECISLCDGMDVSFSVLPPISNLFLQPSMVTQVGGLPIIPLGKVAWSRNTLPGKRIFDFVVASLLLVLFLPVLVATAIAIKVVDRGPLFYWQQRVGQGGRTFRMCKFRSMVVGADKLVIDLRDRNVTNGLLFKVERDPRVTAVGRIIRRLSVDELPQLWNVVRGDMSLVGPRPLAVDPEAFGPLDGKRHSVPPGITGYWQITGGNGLTYEEMVKLDLAYIQNWSIWLDLRLLFRTMPALVHRRGPW